MAALLLPDADVHITKELFDRWTAMAASTFKIGMSNRCGPSIYSLHILQYTVGNETISDAGKNWVFSRCLSRRLLQKGVGGGRSNASPFSSTIFPSWSLGYFIKRWHNRFYPPPENLYAADILFDRTFSQIIIGLHYYENKLVINNVLLIFKIVNYTKFTLVRKFFVLQPRFWMQMPGCKKQHIYMSEVFR